MGNTNAILFKKVTYLFPFVSVVKVVYTLTAKCQRVPPHANSKKFEKVKVQCWGSGSACFGLSGSVIQRYGSGSFLFVKGVERNKIMLAK